MDKLTYEINTTDVKAIYKTVPGWHQSLSEVTTYDEFPEPLKNYVALLEEALEVPIKMVSIGPDRKQTILR